MRGIPHHLLDVISPKKQFSVTEYKKLTEKAIDGIISRGKIPIICGGTGFYIQSIVDGIVLPEVTPDFKLRKKLENKAVKELYIILKKLDPRRAREIDKNNPHRLVRAIEIATVLGKVPRLESRLQNYDVLKIGLKLSGNLLKQKIHIRLFARLSAQAGISRGMINEAKNLHNKGLSWKRMEELGLEYKYLAKYLKKRLTKEQLTNQLENAIWQYAKRQMTWFKRDKEIRWFNPKDLKKIEKEVGGFLK